MIISVVHHGIFFHYEVHLHILFTSNLFPTAKTAAFWANMHMDDLGIHSTLIKLAFSCFPILFLNHEFYLPGHLFPPTCFSDSQDHNSVLSLPFWHLPSSSSLINTEGSGPQSPLIAPAHSETHVFDSSSPHFSLQKVLHWSFILALTRDLVCKATSRSCRLTQVLPWSLASVRVSPQSQITPSSHPLSMLVPWFSFFIFSIFTFHCPCSSLQEMCQAPNMNQKLLGSGDSNSHDLVLTLKYPQSATVGLKPDGTFESSSFFRDSTPTFSSREGGVLVYV